jgi:hypothetical protein
VAKQANEHVVQADEWLARRQADENIILEEREVKLRGENKKLIANVRQLAEVGVTSHEHLSIPRTYPLHVGGGCAYYIDGQTGHFDPR